MGTALEISTKGVRTLNPHCPANEIRLIALFKEGHFKTFFGSGLGGGVWVSLERGTTVVFAHRRKSRGDVAGNVVREERF